MNSDQSRIKQKQKQRNKNETKQAKKILYAQENPQKTNNNNKNE